MKLHFKHFLLAMGFVAFCASAMAQHAGPVRPAIEGRWDLTIGQPNKDVPSWLEVRHSGNHTLVGRFVHSGGSARPISEVKHDNGKFSFSIPPQWESETRYMDVEGVQSGDNMTGTLTYPNGKKYNFTGVRAPSLRRDKAPVWGAPVTLFSGVDLKGWHTTGENQWVVEAGILKSPRSGSNLVTDDKFNDFKLHIEFRYPSGSNSGVYLRGRYEIQVEDSPGTELWDDQFSGVYGFLQPNAKAALGAGEWNAYDITLVGRTVTVAVNGVTVISEAIIPGITGGALDSKEGEPGPFYIQGDHGPIEYRNIIVTPAK